MQVQGRRAHKPATGSARNDFHFEQDNIIEALVGAVHGEVHTKCTFYVTVFLS